VGQSTLQETNSQDDQNNYFFVLQDL